MKGINNRQKMIVAPRESRGRKNQAIQKVSRTEMAQKRRFGLQKAAFRRKTG